MSPFPTYPGHLPSFLADSLPFGGRQHRITPIHQQVQTFQVYRCNHAICNISSATRSFDIASSPDSDSGCNGESLQILHDATFMSHSYSDSSILLILEDTLWRCLEGFCMLLGYYIPSFLCTFNSDVCFRSYAVARIGVFVLPTLTSFTQLDQGIWVTWVARINVVLHIVHSILHPKHFWKSGRASKKEVT